jgi:hypothetical protein
VPQGPTRQREPGSDVQLPGGPCETGGDTELERCDRAARANDPGELAERRSGIGDVTQEVRDGEVVERLVRERERFGRRLDELDSRAEALARTSEHARALIDPGHLESSLQELGGDETRAGGDVDHVPAIPRQSLDEKPAPAGVLPEGERGAHAIVRRAERREQLLCVDRRHDAYCGDMSLQDALDLAAEHALAAAEPGSEVSGVLATEADPGTRVFLCSIDGTDARRGWLAVRENGSVVTRRPELRAAVSIAALCEVAADSAGGGDLDGLISSLADLREREAPEGIEEAEAAAYALRTVIGEPPQLATPARLDEIGGATRRLEQELDPGGASPFAAALKAAQGVVSELQREVEAGYLVELEA